MCVFLINPPVECLKLYIGLETPGWKERRVLGEIVVERARHIEGEKDTLTDGRRTLPVEYIGIAILEHSVAACLHAPQASRDQHSPPSNP